MQKYQADQGWQTKLMPDSRALKKLGLGRRLLLGDQCQDRRRSRNRPLFQRSLQTKPLDLLLRPEPTADSSQVIVASPKRKTGKAT